MASTPDRGGRRRRLALGHRWAAGVAGAGLLTVGVEAPALCTEPFFVGVDTASRWRSWAAR